MHEKVSVSSLNFPEFDLATTLHTLDELGVGTTTLQGTVLESYGWAESVALVQRSGIAIAGCIAPYPKTIADPDSWASMRARFVATLDAASAMGAGMTYTVTGPAIGDRETSFARFADFIAPVASHADSLGVALSVESTLPEYHSVSFAHSLADGLDLRRSTGVSLCFDLYHHWDDPLLTELLTVHPDAISLVQIGDSVTDGELHPKVLPGDGDVPIAGLIDRAIAASYRGVFDIELTPGKAITEYGYVSAAREAALRLDRILASR